eukprot:36263_1
MATAPAAPTLPTVITINDQSPDEQVQLAFTKTIRHYSLCTFFGLILFNFIFYVVFFSISGMAFIFPANDILSSYYDPTNASVIAIFTANCVILILCILSEVKLTEMHITIKSYFNWLTFYIMLNLFYIFLTPILLLPIVKLLSISNCYSFKNKINQFLDPQSTQTDETDNDKHFRLIAAHHFLSKLCYKLKLESLRSHDKEANNKTLYQLLSEGLDHKLREIMDRNDRLDEDELSLNNEQFSPKQIYRMNVVHKSRAYDMKRKVFLRLYLLAINVSMIRLVFFNDNIDLQGDHFGLYVLFWTRMAIEIVLFIVLVVLMRTDAKIKKIAKNMIGTQFYFAVLLSAEYKTITKVIFDNFEQECGRFYTYWHYELYGIDTKILLTQHLGHDIGCVVFQFLFDDDVHCVLNDSNALDIDEQVWKEIKETAFPNNP